MGRAANSETNRILVGQVKNVGILVGFWRRIGARLYLALGFAVVLTLVSSAVGVYYFEVSGDLNFRVRSETVPALEAAWAASGEADALRSFGLRLLTDPGLVDLDGRDKFVARVLERLEGDLSTVSGSGVLAQRAAAVQEGAYTLAAVVDRLVSNRENLAANELLSEGLRAQLWEYRFVSAVDRGEPSPSEVELLFHALSAHDQPGLDSLWSDFTVLVGAGLDPRLAELGKGNSGVFAVRGGSLALEEQAGELAGDFGEAALALDRTVAELVDDAGLESASALTVAVQSFDQGRVLLAAISVASVLLATLASWLWVGNGLVRRLSRLSGRMRDMAAGDLETPVPEVSRDEIGELAGALEVFRRQALEVQRLNLVEQLYGELQRANAELQRMQARLVAQEKLAALGELVSGVAHEISNPLNFVENFAEVAVEMYGELSEVLETYRSEMSEDDLSLVEELGRDLSDSLNRVQSNSGRALAIVERMRGLGVVGGELRPTDLNSALRSAVQVAVEAFQAQWPELAVELSFDLEELVGEVPMVEGDFGEAVVNLVSNGCYAMWLRHSGGEADGGGEYLPVLRVSSRLAGEMVEVRIGDNGTGITDEVLGHIFNPFFSTRDGALGAGLGLPIAADVARRTGGDLTVDTVFGEYTEFLMRLPAGGAALSVALSGV